ncbi:hypothetical protein DMN91_008682 [Ooceraea biroi]|uniref:Importin-13 n=1 Tax=Ooceraea biroi TaxID=2015173 RepID=A0A026WP00_OOCBI|nr:importin-13 [Ooceraea biroi]EZA57401.1 Importin-13 [Ooceraea biroi]RLU18325.1 hypothetical protein DMN91_008682 [Ooceraea biroi]
MDYVTAIEVAVKQFYSRGDNDAHSWLLQMQASTEAWQFVWQLLGPTKTLEVQFFAATTLHLKISKQWNEVPEVEYPQLQERLLVSVRRPNTPPFILVKLCQALAAYVANVYGRGNRTKDGSLVDELFDILPYDSPPALELLLRVLSTLPVEYERRNELKRAKLREAIFNSWCQTAWFLQQVFLLYKPDAQNDSLMLYTLGLECAQSWLKVGHLPLDVTGQIYPHLLVAAAYYAPSRDGVDNENVRNWEIVQDSLIMIVTHCELYKRPQTFWEWAQSLVSMAREHSGKDFCEILTAIGETHSRTFLIALALENENETHVWTASSLIELLLECSEQEGRYPTEEARSCIPFGFWYALQDDLSTLDQPLENRALQVLKPIYFRLAQALLRKSALPASQSEGGDAEDRELFRCYRQDAADTLDYCYSVLGDDLLALLGQRLSQTLEDVPWTYVESTLHAFRALAESVGTQEYCYIPALLDLILGHIPYHLYPEEILACVCSTLGAYAEWIGEHPEPWLAKVLQLVTQGLTKGTMTVPFASMALKDLARECGPHLASYAPSILHTISQTLPNVAPGGGEGLRLMYAAGKLLNVLPFAEQQLVHLEATLGLCVTKMKELLEQPLFTARVGVTNYLKMATMFFSTVEGAIGKAVLDGLLPVFNQIITHPEWSQDNATLEAMHMCAQRSLSALRYPETEARPLLLILSTSYKIWPHPAALNLLKQLIVLFGRDPENVIGPVLAEISLITLNGVKACRLVQGDLSDWSDLMEAYLSVLAQICKKNARILLQIPDQIPDMLQCGIACLTLPETPTAKAAGNFLHHAIMQSPHLQTFVQPIGQELVSAILHCVGGGTSHSNFDPHAEVLLALNKTCPEWTAQWLRAGLENQKGLAAVVLQKDILTRILRERTNRSKLCEVLKEFSIQCRQETGL